MNNKTAQMKHNPYVIMSFVKALEDACFDLNPYKVTFKDRFRILSEVVDNYLNGPVKALNKSHLWDSIHHHTINGDYSHFHYSNKVYIKDATINAGSNGFWEKLKEKNMIVTFGNFEFSKGIQKLDDVKDGISFSGLNKRSNTVYKNFNEAYDFILNHQKPITIDMFRQK